MNLEKNIENAKRELRYALTWNDETLYNVIFNTLKEKLEAKPYIEVKASEALFVGDLHGDLETLLSAAKHIGKRTLIFLGDYADRGPDGLEVLLGALLLKAAYPRKVYLLRGNHEDPNVNARYGLLDELEEKLAKPAAKLNPQIKEPWELADKILGDIAKEVYAHMPVVVLVQTSHHRVLALHGGPTQDLTPQKAAQLPMQPTPTDEALVDILWSDPREGVEEPLPSYRGAGKIYGQKTVEKALKNFGADILVRAHEKTEGVAEMFQGKLYTVFSSRHYKITPAFLAINKKPQKIPA